MKVVRMDVSAKYVRLQQIMDDYSTWVRSSADAVLSIINVLDKTIVDFGCGRGDWLTVARALGAKEVLGLDSYAINEHPLDIPSLYTDITQPVQLDKRYDVAICLEVAEHIAETYADTLIDSLVHAAPVILFSAAVKGQGGIHHVNEQPPAYWYQKFIQHGYQCYDFRHLLWNNTAIEPWYRMGCLVYIHQDHPAELLKQFRTDAAPLHLIHPDIFEAYAPLGKDIILHWDKTKEVWFPEFLQ